MTIEKEKFKQEIEARNKKWKEQREIDDKILRLIERVETEGESDVIYEELKKEVNKCLEL